MSIYSLDSLENVDQHLDAGDALNGTVTENNPENSHLNNVSLSPLVNDDGGSNETVQNCSRDRKTKTLDGRNAIIARGGLANASRRLESSTTRTTKTKRNDEGGKEDEKKEKEKREKKHESVHPEEEWKNRGNERTKKTKDDRLARKPMGFFSQVVPFSTKCGFHVEGGGIVDESSMEVTMKANKKLNNVLLHTSNGWTRNKPETSYLEIHRRRTSLPRYKRVVRSPEGSTLSIYGDSQREELNTEEESGRVSCSSRDDQSELSFYRRLIERSATPRLPRTSRSCETERDRNGCLCITGNSPKSSDNSPGTRRTPFKSSVSESKLSKKSTYKPYTIEDYRSLPVPKPDRSLGPDRDEISAKREWLTRRRSYGDSVSERNRQRMVHTVEGFKSRRIASRKCFLSPLKHRDTDPMTRMNSSMEKMENERSSGKGGRNHSAEFAKSKKTVPTSSSFARKPNSSRRTKKQGKLTNRGTVLHRSEIFEDSYLDSLRQRHLREKELVDKIIKKGTSL